MNATQVAHRSIELLLTATYKSARDGSHLSFLFGTPGASMHQMHAGISLFMDRIELLQAALYVRNDGPAYLRDLSVSEVQSKLTNFLMANYGYIAEETWLKNIDGNLREHVSDKRLVDLAQAFEHSEIFTPRMVLTLFPLATIRIDSDYNSESFFLVEPLNLGVEQLGCKLHPRDLVPTRFPPYADWKGVQNVPASWLGIRSPSLSTSKKMRNAVLGAVALLPHPRERYVFTGRKVFGGHVTFDGGWSISPGSSHTPPISEDIIIKETDRVWLDVLASKLREPDSTSRKHIRALEYYYRAWSLAEVDRFPVLFQSLDAIFGDASQATRAIVDAVGPMMGAAYDYKRLKLIMSLRGSVVHGGAPDVYESNKYISYYREYLADPIYDLELITARCIQVSVFGGALTSRPHTYAALYKDKTGMELDR